MSNHADFEREVLELLNTHLGPLGSPDLGGPQVFHSTRLEGQYPDTEVVVVYSYGDDPTRHEYRDRIWDYVEKYAETDPESPHAEDVVVLIATYVRGG